jgi:predicted ribosome quality control (RQC) complex YloA/Tae2 family protein
MLDKDLEALRPLFGGRIQKVDLVGKSELVLHLRYPGRTILLLLAPDRAGVVAERPERAIDGGELQRALRKRIEGRPLIALELEQHVLVVDAKDTRFSLKKNGIEWLPPSGREPPPVPLELPDHFPTAVSKAADDLKKRIEAKKKKLKKLAQNLARDRDKLVAMEAAKKIGELLKTELQRIPRGTTQIALTDWETGEDITVELDPATSAKANMERFFVKAKKAERGLPQVAKRLKMVEAQLADLEQGVLPDEPAEQTRIRSDGHATERKRPIDKVSRLFVAADGTEIRVGKGASENDRLTLSFAKGDDVWLHASGTQGAHVLLKASKGKPPSADALLDAATLAAHYSGAKNDSKVEVVWTEARYVKKTKGDPPGRVSVAKGRTILVAMEKARIDRLFGRV